MHRHLVKPSKLKGVLGSLESQGHRVVSAEKDGDRVLLECEHPDDETGTSSPLSSRALVAKFGARPRKRKAG